MAAVSDPFLWGRAVCSVREGGGPLYPRKPRGSRDQGAPAAAWPRQGRKHALSPTMGKEEAAERDLLGPPLPDQGPFLVAEPRG